MKVCINFEPLSLISVCAQIRKEYKNKYDYENPPSGHLEELIDEISKISVSSLENYAMMLKEYDVNYLAYHLPKEENIIINTKILRIIIFRLSEEVFNIYFLSWQKHYNYLSNNLGTKNLFTLSDKAVEGASFLPKKIYDVELRSKMLLNPVDELLSVCVSETSDRMNSEISEILSVLFLISPSSVLGINILKKIYLYCSEKHFLKTSDLELCNIANSYILDEKIKFFINFVTKVNPSNYKKYLKLADLARTCFKNKIYKLDDLETPIKIKFQMWFSLLDIDSIFGEDERGRFWKARAIENNAIRVEKKYLFDMVVMYFSKFVVTEFLNKADGPIYIVSNDEYYSQLNSIIRRASSKAELKSRLFHQYKDTSNRIPHRGDWRKDARIMINSLNKRKVNEE